MMCRVLKEFLVVALLAILAPHACFADQIYYVRTSGSDANSGVSTSKAFRTVQRALNGCANDGGGFTIVVGPGTYTEQLSISAGSGSFGSVPPVGNGTTSKPNIILGDTSGDETGDTPGRVIISGGSSRAYGVRLTSRSNWQFQNLTFRDQTLHAISVAGGSGFLVRSCTIKPPPGTGVGVYSTGTNIVLEANTFERTSLTGHCTYINPATSGSAVFRENRFSLLGAAYLSSPFRTGKGWNGVVFNINNLPTLASSMFPGFALGLVAFSVTPGVQLNAVFENNVGSDCLTGIGAYLLGNSTSRVRVSNNTITGCVHPIYVFSDAAAGGDIVNNIGTDSYGPIWAYMPAGRMEGVLQNNIASILSSTVSSLGATLVGDPRFANPAGGNFALLRGSPAIDAGVVPGAPFSDLNGKLRPFDGDRDGIAEIDLGALEFLGTGGLRIVSWNQRDQMTIPRLKLPPVKIPPVPKRKPQDDDDDDD